MIHVFTPGEKRLLRGELFRRSSFADVDFSSADLRDAMFDRASLRGCDFSRANLRGAVFLRCDLRRARFEGARFGKSPLDECWFIGAIGIGRPERARIESIGGRFLKVGIGAKRKREWTR